MSQNKYTINQVLFTVMSTTSDWVRGDDSKHYAISNKAKSLPADGHNKNFQYCKNKQEMEEHIQLKEPQQTHYFGTFNSSRMPVILPVSRL